MSSLSNLPYGKILDYWYERLSGNRYRMKFLATKLIEMFIFKSHSGKNRGKFPYLEFPESKRNELPAHPTISLIIPAYVRNVRDVATIKALFNSIEQQIIKPNYVIVVDDCSPLSFDCNATHHYHRLNTNSGPAKARNIGKQIALELSSDIIAFTDTDCILSADWISVILSTFKMESTFHILSGNTVSADTHWFGTYHNINGTLNGRVFSQSERLLYGTTANLAITNSVARIIYFNENFPIAAGEDIEFCFHANTKGFAIKHVPSMTVFHNYGYSNDLIDDLRQFRGLFKKYGQGERILLQEIPEYYSYFDKTVEIPSIL